MEFKSHEDIVKAKELDDLCRAGNQDNGVLMPGDFLARKLIAKMTMPDLGKRKLPRPMLFGIKLNKNETRQLRLKK